MSAQHGRLPPRSALCVAMPHDEQAPCRTRALLAGRVPWAMSGMLQWRRQQLCARLLLAAVLSASARLGSTQAGVPSNGCASILQAGAYRTFYVGGDTGPYVDFQRAVCALPSNDANELALPLDAAGEAAFTAAAAVLVKGWRANPVAPSRADFSVTNAYKVVRDYHTATCKVRAGPGCIWQPVGGSWSP